MFKLRTEVHLLLLLEYVLLFPRVSTGTLACRPQKEMSKEADEGYINDDEDNCNGSAMIVEDDAFFQIHSKRFQCSYHKYHKLSVLIFHSVHTRKDCMHKLSNHILKMSKMVS